MVVKFIFVYMSKFNFNEFRSDLKIIWIDGLFQERGLYKGLIFFVCFKYLIKFYEISYLDFCQIVKISVN